MKFLLLFCALVLLPGLCLAERSNFFPCGNHPLLISHGRIEIHPSFENASVYINRLPEEQSDPLTATLSFREKNSEPWQKGPELFFLEQEQAWRASLTGLQENTEYELEAVIGKETLRNRFRTRDSQVRIAETIVLNAQNCPDGILRIDQSGQPDGWIRYIAETGFILKNRQAAHALITLSKAAYVMLDGLTIQGDNAKHAILLDKTENIIIRNCDLSGFGIPGRRDYSGPVGYRGSFVYSSGKIINWNAGIFCHNTFNTLIEKCYIHDAAGFTTSWMWAHPSGTEAVFLDSDRGGAVLRYNDFIGSDLHPWNDAVETHANRSPDGGFFRDADIYGNLFAFANDDAIELEGGGMNLRFYGNRCEGSYCGTSTGATFLGPVYIFNNLFLHPGDVNGRKAVAFKNSTGENTYGPIVIRENTAIGWGILGGINNTPLETIHKKLIFEKNILSETGEWFSPFTTKWNVRIENNILSGLKSSDPERVDGNLYRNIVFRSPETGDYHPSETISGYGAFSRGRKMLPYRPLPFTLSHSCVKLDSGTVTVRVNTDDLESPIPFRILKNRDFEFFKVSPEAGVLQKNQRMELSVSTVNSALAEAKLYRGAFLLKLENGLSRPVMVYRDHRNDLALMNKNLAEATAATLEVNLTAGKPCLTNITIPQDGCYTVFVEIRGKGRLNAFCRMGTESAPERTCRIYPESDQDFYCLPLHWGRMSYFSFNLTAGEIPFEFIFKGGNAIIRKIIITKNPEVFARFTDRKLQ